MYHASTQGTDERMINVHYHYYINTTGGECAQVIKMMLGVANMTK